LDASHRARLRERFISGEVASRSDEALLELLLAYAIPQRDVQPLAKALLTRFNGLDGVLAADPSALNEISGVKDSTIALLKLAHHFRTTAQRGGSAEPSPLKPSLAPVPAVTPPAKPLLPTAPVAVDSISAPRRLNERKLQVSNGYLLV